MAATDTAYHRPLPPVGLLHEAVEYWATSEPDADFLIGDGVTHSYGEGLALITEAAERLHAAGVGPGDRVCVVTNPSPGFAISLFATLRLGAVWVGLNPKYRKPEIDYVLDDCQPAVVIVEQGLDGQPGAGPTISSAAERGLPVYVLGRDPGDGGLPAAAGQGPDPGTTPDSAAFIVYTSGTTGYPKGAVLSHRAPQIIGAEMYRQLRVAQPRVLANLPCNHVGGVSEMTLAAVVNGGCLIYQARFDPGEVFDLIARYRISCWFQVPTMFQLALDQPEARDADLSSIEAIMVGGAVPTLDLTKRLRAITPNLANSFGMTETAGGVTWTPFEPDDDAMTGTVGEPVPAFGMRIADEAGNELPAGVVGELQFKGDFLFTEYWNRPEATRDTFTDDGWFKTGDLAMVNDAGAVCLTGRAKEMFKSGGYNVYPLEIEQLLTRHDCVAEAVIVPVPDPLFNEVGHAFIRVKPATSVTQAALVEYCKEHLANYKVPKHWCFAGSLPMLPNGKHDRTGLKESAEALLRSQP